MELALNIIWLAIAFGAFVKLPRARRNGAATIAFFCAMVLLFPVISMTDDLASSHEAIEESAAIRRAVSAASHADVALHISRALAILSTIVAAAALAAAAAGAGPQLLPRYRFVLSSTADPRSPPALRS